MRHYIDDKLIAVGVNDYTNLCLSSVYFFYDPEYEFLSLGTIGALREIEHVRKLYKSFAPSFEYYYMGLYY